MPSLALGRLDDPRARRAQLLDQACVLKQHQRGCGQPLDDVGVGIERWIVDQSGNRPVAPGDASDTARPRVAWKLQRRTVNVDVTGALGGPQGERDGRKADRTSDRAKSPQTSTCTRGLGRG
jgi:hypothetical protein